MCQITSLHGQECFSADVCAAIPAVGPMNDSSMPMLSDLRREIAKNTDAKVIVMSVRDVPEISGDAIQFLAQLQKFIRERPSEIRFCGMKPVLKSKLLSRGIIRTNEVFDNLQLAIQSPVKPQQKKAA